MKKITILSALYLSLSSLLAQNYGELMYPHSGYYLSSGLPTNINSTGFVSATYLPSGNVEEYNFIVDKSDDYGVLNGTDLFSRGYMTLGVSSCVQSLSQILDCNGVSIIEINPVLIDADATTTAWYALAGTNSVGTFFATLSRSGIVLSSAMYMHSTSSLF